MVPGVKPDGGVRSSWPTGSARTRSWPRPPAFAPAYARRQEGGNAGGDLVGDGAGGLVAGTVAAREARGSGGGAGGFGWRRGLAPAASSPPKRRAVSSTRRLPPVHYWREPACPVLRSGGGEGGGEGGLRVGAPTSHGGLGGGEGVLPQALLEKVAAAKGGASAADWYPHGPEASVGSSGVLGIYGEGGFFGPRSDQLGNKHYLEILAVQDEELEEGEIADTMEITQGMIKNDALSTEIERQELEEGKIAATMDIVEAGMNKNAVDGPVEGHELEEGEIATTMDIVAAMNEDALFGSVESQEELEEGEIASPLDIVEAMNEDTFDGAVEEFERGVIAATMGTVESMNNQALHEVAVVVQDLKESEIAAMDIVEGTNKETFVGPVDDRELEDEFAAKRHGQEPDDGQIATKTDHTVQQPQISVDVIPRDSPGGIMRRKIKFTVGKTVQPPVKANHMSQLVTLDRPFSSTSATAMKTQLVTLDRPFSSTSATAMKKFKPASIDLASTSALASKEKRKFESVFVTKEKLKGKRVVYLEDDDILMAVAVHEGKLELCLGAPSRVHVWRHRPHGREPYADPRIRVRMMCRRFQFLCRFLAQAVKQGSVELSRVDLAADNAIKKLPDYIKYGSIVGEVDGVEVGDEFLFRVELAIVGLHNPIRAGIDTTKDKDGEPIAVSIVASGGYLDKYSSSGELIYIGSGGKAAGTGQDGDQKLERGNLALQNCIERKIPVRVTHGFKTPNREEEGSHSIGKEMPKFIYDGLYHVVGFWEEGEPGSRVFKYTLRRKRGQPELPLHVAKWLRKSVVRPR